MKGEWNWEENWRESEIKIKKKINLGEDKESESKKNK